MIPELLGEENLQLIPWAELWMGIHPSAPSMCIDDEKERKISLPNLIQEHPDFYLGGETMKAFGTLPFLYKVLSADKPLSIQAHPNLEQAKAGFERENRAGIDINAPNRNYKDANHKPEILCALSPFTAMCGFREACEIEKLLTAIHCSALDAPLSALKDTSSKGGLKGFLGELFSMNAENRKMLTDTILENSFLQNVRALSIKYDHYKTEFDLCVLFAQLHPEDASIIAPLYLNLIQLKPGEAIFLPAGILHAYVHGLGMELMANSDNVLRGGLTSKYIDTDELNTILEFKPFMPEIIKPLGSDQSDQSDHSVFAYKTGCKDFELTYYRGKGGILQYNISGPSIIFVIDGSLTLKDTDKNKILMLKKGESAFLPPSGKSGRVVFDGDFKMYSALTGLHQ